VRVCGRPLTRASTTSSEGRQYFGRDVIEYTRWRLDIRLGDDAESHRNRAEPELHSNVGRSSNEPNLTEPSGSTPRHGYRPMRY